MKITENERIYSALLEDKCDWEAFYGTADLIENKLKIQFHQKIDDFDSKYWDFKFLNKEFILHYHEMTEELDIFTDKKNGKEILKQLVNKLYKTNK